MWSEVSESLIHALRADGRVRESIPALETAVSDGRIPAGVAARQLLDTFLKTE